MTRVLPFAGVDDTALRRVASACPQLRRLSLSTAAAVSPTGVRHVAGMQLTALHLCCLPSPAASIVRLRPRPSVFALLCCARGTGEVLNQTPASSLAPLTILNVEREQPQPWRPRFVASPAASIVRLRPRPSVFAWLCHHPNTCLLLAVPCPLIARAPTCNTRRDDPLPQCHACAQRRHCCQCCDCAPCCDWSQRCECFYGKCV